MKDLHKKSEKDLKKALADLRAKLLEFRFGSAGSHLRDVKEARNVKKDIARILTELNKRVKSEN